MKKSIGIILLAGIILCSSASAGGNEETKAKSPGTATALSLVGTLVPTGAGVLILTDWLEHDNERDLSGLKVFFGGAVLALGPGLGHYYANNSGRFWGGFGLRAAGYVVALTSAYYVADDDSKPKKGLFPLICGAGLYTISSIHDVATAGNSARQYNEKHGLTRVSISPAYFANQNAPGIQLAISF